MSTKVEKWKASDVQLFDTEEEADQHEDLVEFVEYLDVECGLACLETTVIALLKESKWAVRRKEEAE